MMRVLHNLIGAALLLALLFGCGFLVFNTAGSLESWNAFVGNYLSQPDMVCYAAAALFLLVLLYVSTGIRRRDNDKFLSFTGEGGTVSVSFKGISAFISKLGGEFDGVKGLRARVVPAGNSIDVIVEVKIREGMQIHEVCEILQQRVREKLARSLGLTDIRNVTINVREIMLSRGKLGWDDGK